MLANLVVQQRRAAREFVEARCISVRLVVQHACVLRTEFLLASSVLYYYCLCYAQYTPG